MWKGKTVEREEMSEAAASTESMWKALGQAQNAAESHVGVLKAARNVVM